MVGVAACGGSESADCSQFDPGAWRAAASDTDIDTPARRQEMADVLIECDELDGMKRGEVGRLLGASNDYVADRRERSWTTGPERGYGFDEEHLVVRFDAGGRVRSVGLEID